MAKKSYNVNDHTSARTWVHRQFIENVIKGLRVTGHKDRAWFPFTSQDRNITDHKTPDITEKTRQIYFFIPPHARFVAATQFLDIMKSGNFKPSDKLPDCYNKAVKRKAFLKTIFKEEPHPCPEDIGKKKSDNIKILRSYSTKYTSLKKDAKTFADLLAHQSFCRYFDVNLYKVLQTVDIPKNQTLADFKKAHADDLEVAKINAFHDLAKNTLDATQLNETHQNFIENRNNRGLKEYIGVLNAIFSKTDIKNIHDDFQKFQQTRLQAKEDLSVKTTLKDDVAARVKTVCQYLPKHRPITLTLPLHFGGHYHTYNARIYDDHTEIQAIATIRGYKDTEVMKGIKQGIEEGLKNRAKKIYEPQGDGVSCGPTSTVVSVSVDHTKTLEEQTKAMKNAVKSYRENRPGIKSVLADIHYAVSGLTLTDIMKTKGQINNDQIMMETMQYCSLYNKTRPFTFGLRLRSNKHLAVYAVRVTDDHCEVLSISNLDSRIDQKHIKAIQHGIQAALGVEDSFFKEPTLYDYNSDEDDISGKAETDKVATRIDPTKSLELQADDLAQTVIGEEKYHKELQKGYHETTFSFQCRPLTEEQIIAKQPEWDKALKEQMAKKYVPSKPPSPKRKRSSGDDDVESGAGTSSESMNSEEKAYIKLQARIAAEKEEREELDKAFKRILEIKRKKSPHLPLPVVFDHAKKAVIRSRKQKLKSYNEENLNRVLQYNAIDLLQTEYESQQEKYKHDLKVARILSGVFFFIPGISHAFIWGIFHALHKDDIVKLRLHRKSYNEFEKASKGDVDYKPAVDLIHHPESSPTKKIKGRRVFDKVYGEGEAISDNIPGQVHIYFWDPKKAKAFQKDYTDWLKYEAPETSVVSTSG